MNLVDTENQSLISEVEVTMWLWGCAVPKTVPEVFDEDAYTYTQDKHEDEPQRVKGDLYVPNGRGPFPAVVLVPGGAFKSADIEDVSLVRWAKRLQEEGYVVFTVQYRVQEDFSESPSFPAPVEDIACAVRWLRANATPNRVDGERIAVMGSSAGGHLVTMLGLGAGDSAVCGATDAERTEVQGVIDFYGPEDWTTIREQRGKEMIAPEQYYVGSACAAPDDPLCIQASYMPWISPEAPPFFVAHSVADPSIPVEQSRELVAALEENGSDVTFHQGEGLKHGWWSNFSDPEVAEVRDEVLVWLDERIGQ